jgi:hypothetical protein
MIKKGFRVEMAAATGCRESPYKKRTNAYKSRNYRSQGQSRIKGIWFVPLAQGLQFEIRDNEVGGLQGERTR